MKSRPIKSNGKRVAFIYDVFGGEKNLVNMVREKLEIPNDADGFLTDEIILAPLHIDVAMITSEDATALEDYKNPDVINCCLYNLCGSICHALASRVKDDRFSARRTVDYLKAAQRFHSVAACCEMQLKKAGD